ncbi:hypothetical protein IFT43_20605 [Oxalobacteraceae sp. CFBP 13708]|nr:hypothetical protein [Oxalobacteraceae sp. CFBP 13708]
MAVQQAVRLRSNELYTGGASGLATTYGKYEFEAAFTEVQILIGSKVASGTPGTFKAQVAVTDEIGVDSVTKAFVPMRNGIPYNDKSEFGWKDVTFGGAASKQIGLAPSTDGKSVIHMSTDVMSLASVARADGKPGAILLVKIVQIDASGAFTQESTSNSSWGGARGTKPWFREVFTTKRANVDGIATLTALPTSSSDGSTGYSQMSFPIVNSVGAVSPELILFTGDSRKSAAYSSFAFNNPNRQAAMSLSAPGRPVSIVNAAGSGHEHSQYLQVARDMITAGLRPSIIYQPGFSQNGFVDYTTFKTKNDEFMAWVRAIPGMENVKFVLDTDYYTSGYNGNKEIWRQQCIAYAKSLANGSTVFCFDSDSIITDYSTPSAPVIKPAYLVGGDAAHVGPSGQDVLTYGAGADAGLVSVYKTLISSTTTVLPGAPTIGTATAGSKSAVVAGTAPASTGGGAITGYRATSTPGGIVGTSATLPVPVSGLTDGTVYTFKLEAQSSAGYGPASFASNSVTPATAETADTTAPLMTGDITVSGITTSGAALSCPAATDAVGVAGYEYSIDGGTSYTVIANAARSVTVSGRPTGTAHAVRMRAFDAAGNRATPLSASFTTLVQQPAQNAVSASTVAESRRVAFPGGTRVVKFGSVPSARLPNAPYLETGRWWSEKHPLDERYWVADITIDLAERGTTAKEVVALVAGVTVIEDPVIQGKLIAVKLGGFNAAIGASNFCTLRITLANGERIDRTTWFKQQVGVYLLDKDPDEQSYFVGDIGNDLVDSNTTATQVKALPVGVEELVPAVIQGSLILLKLGGMDTLPAGANYCDFRIDCANSERFYRTIQFNRVDN